MRILIVFFLTFSICLANTYKVNAQEQNKRYVLLEEFSNTYCPPCIFRHPTFNEKILAEHEDIEVYHISYHVGAPIPDDIFYQANIEEVEERASYYQIFGTPSLYTLGEFSPSGAAPDYEILPTPRLENKLGSISPVKIEVNESLTDSGERKVDIEVHSIHQMIPNPNFKLKVVVVEKVIEYEPPFEGMETTLHNIFRKTLGTWDGISFNPATVGESVIYEYTYPIEDAWNPSQIYVIAFVQDDNNKSVLNAGSSWKNEAVDIEISTPETSLQLYPNPSNDFIHIDTKISLQSAQIFDIQGHLMKRVSFTSFNTNTSIDLRDLPKGIYYLSLQSENQNIVEKIIKW